MRRFIAVIPLVLVMAFPAGALAGKAVYEGKGVDDPEAVFRFVLRDQKRIRPFTARNILLDCPDGETRYRRVRMLSRIPISDRGKFEDTQQNEDGSRRAKVRGDIDGRRARGEWKFSGTFEEGDCSTGGWIPWRARR